MILRGSSVFTTKPLTTCEHSGSSNSAGMPPLLSNTSTICSCSSAGKPKKQIFCPSNAFSLCSLENSSVLARNPGLSRCSQAAYTQAGLTTASSRESMNFIKIDY
ncbi:hypothetical protein GQX74_002640 [Glossina fuscipes]|nr:hypothetical protein GQX74_002640 [Glossina fuscipes]